jgi:type I restriction enzyme S subunit
MMEIAKGYQQTEVGIIPIDWKVKELSQIVESERPISYGIVQTGKYIENGIRCIRVLDILNGKVNNKNLIRTSEEISSSYRRTILRTGDIVIALRGKIGELAVIEKGLAGANLTRGLALIAAIEENYNYFLYYYLSSPQSKLILEKNLNGSALKEIPIGVLRKISVPLPPTREEQKAIAQALSDVDAAIAELDRLITKKRNIKQGTMQQLLTGKRPLAGFSKERPYKQTEIGVIPEDWMIKPLKTISSMSGRIGWQGLKQEEFTFNESDPFLITGMNFKDGKIRWKEVYHILEKRYQEDKKIQLKDGDILMTKDGTIGKLLYVEEIPFPGKASLNSHLLVFRPLNNAYEPKFLFYQLTSKQFADYVNLNKSGSTFFGITQEAVGNYATYLPPIKEQKAIAQVLSDMDTEIEALEQKRDKYKAIKQGMMQELLTGRTRLI